MVTSKVYPGLERKPGGPDNWVEATGGLPAYIERIAKHLHYERGMTISHAIATAVNTVKRWARKGGVVKYGDPNNMHVTTVTAAQAAAAVAAWEAKKAAARAGAGGRGRGTLRGRSISLATEDPMNLAALAHRADAIADPVMRSEARAKILDLTVPAAVRKASAQKGTALPDGSFPINNTEQLQAAIKLCGNAKDPIKAKRHIISRARALGATHMIPKTWDLSEVYGHDVVQQAVIDLALTKDGRKSFKRRGKWKHGFIPVDNEAKTAKAKGSPIAMKRMNRLFGGGGQVKNKDVAVKLPQKIGRESGDKAAARNQSERVADVGQSIRATFKEASPTQRTKPLQLEESRGRRPQKRSEKPWDEIPESQKTIRNGKRYVLARFGGKETVTEWIGSERDRDVEAPDPRDKVMTNISTADLGKLTTAALRRMLEMPNVPAHVRKVLNKELTRKENAGLVRGKRVGGTTR